MSESLHHMKWSDLLARAELQGQRSGDADPIVHNVVEDSREVRPGACFVAMRGSKADGHRFIATAIADGAVAIVCEQGADFPPIPAHIASIILPSARGSAGRLAAALHGLDILQKNGQLRIAGITGTNGKSTFCFLLRSILQAAHLPTALLGTIEYDLLARKIEANLTTPAAAKLMSYLTEAAGAGAANAVLEVSSIALDQGRCDGIDFNVAVFSNLTGDHLDYHGTIDAYFAAKKRLFDRLSPAATAVTNIDDPAGERIIADTRARLLRYGIRDHSSASKPASPDGTWLWAQVHEYKASGTRFDLQLVSGGRTIETVCIETLLVGRHNVQNCLAAAGAALGLGLSLQQIAAGLGCVTAVPGRLQRVSPSGGAVTDINVLVDYAHTDDALANVLSALRPLTPGRLIALFGCGGDRDKTKRPRMAKVAARYADRIVVTSDNPRTENPQDIIRDVLAGFSPEELTHVLVEPDRRQAIMAAIAPAQPGDVVLLAGKGHESYQIIGHEKLPFDDSVIAGEMLQQRLTGKGGA